jgi:hypothetical protein
MKKTKLTALRKLFSALALVLAITVFIGSNSVAFAAATQPETKSQTSSNTVSDSQQTYKLTVVSNDNGGDSQNRPKKAAMGYKQAAQIGANYIQKIFGESIDGKAVEMVYAAWPHSSKTYWIGDVFVDKSKIPNTPYFERTDDDSPFLYRFSIDAVTGEWVRITEKQPKPQVSKVKETMGLDRFLALMDQPPDGIDEYIKIAKAFAQKHFTKTKVVDAEFLRYICNANKGSIFAIEIYEKGAVVCIAVTDDTGRVAEVDVDMDTKRAYSLDTSNSDNTDDGESD